MPTVVGVADHAEDVQGLLQSAQLLEGAMHAVLPLERVQLADQEGRRDRAVAARQPRGASHPNRAG